MDITTLAAWGEFLGGIAVVVSLVYLAVQLRDNTKTVRASNYSYIAAASIEANTSILDDKVASLLVRGLEDFEALGAEDQWRFNSLMALMVSPVHRAWDLHETALIDDKMNETQAHAWIALYENPGVKDWWKTSQHWWPAEFRNYLDDLIHEGEATG